MKGRCGICTLPPPCKHSIDTIQLERSQYNLHESAFFNNMSHEASQIQYLNQSRIEGGDPANQNLSTNQISVEE